MTSVAMAVTSIVSPRKAYAIVWYASPGGVDATVSDARMSVSMAGRIADARCQMPDLDGLRTTDDR